MDYDDEVGTGGHTNDELYGKDRVRMTQLRVKILDRENGEEKKIEENER